MNMNEIDPQYIFTTFRQNKIQAIKYVRKVTGSDLKTAKKFIDCMYASGSNGGGVFTKAANDPTDFLHRIKSLPGADTFGTRKEIKYLETIMLDGEIVHAVSSGLMQNRTWLLASTNKRVILVNCNILIGKQQMEIPLNQINSISFKTGIVFSTIVIHHGSAYMKIEQVMKGSEKFFVEETNKAMREYSTNVVIQQPVQSASAPSSASDVSVADEIMKLKQLLDCGALTQEEFDIQKKKLLL